MLTISLSLFMPLMLDSVTSASLEPYAMNRGSANFKTMDLAIEQILENPWSSNVPDFMDFDNVRQDIRSYYDNQGNQGCESDDDCTHESENPEQEKHRSVCVQHMVFARHPAIKFFQSRELSKKLNQQQDQQQILEIMPAILSDFNNALRSEVKMLHVSKKSDNEDDRLAEGNVDVREAIDNQNVRRRGQCFPKEFVAKRGNCERGLYCAEPSLIVDEYPNQKPLHLQPAKAVKPLRYGVCQPTQPSYFSRAHKHVKNWWKKKVQKKPEEAAPSVANGNRRRKASAEQMSVFNDRKKKAYDEEEIKRIAQTRPEPTTRAPKRRPSKMRTVQKRRGTQEQRDQVRKLRKEARKSRRSRKRTSDFS